MKRCPKCSHDKSPDDFYKDKRRRDGRRAYCKECEQKTRARRAPQQRAYFRRYYESNRERFAERNVAAYEADKEGRSDYNREYRKDRRVRDPAAVILTRTRSRAKRLGLPFDLRKSDLRIPDRCPVLGIPILCEPVGRKGGAPNSPSIDRIDPTKGYIRGNARIISNRANTLKNDATIEELEAVLTDLRNIKGADS